jgi:Na+/H+ antiporter NhaD/arsenite permease-like protein
MRRPGVRGGPVTAILAVAVFVVAYILIATERIPKVTTALTGAGIVLGIGVLSAEDAFFSSETGIDWDVIFLLFGMMIIVAVLRRTGVFEYVAIWAAKRAKGSPFRVMLLLVLMTALASALLDNVTTVLLIAPVTLLVCDRLAISPVPFLIAEVLASNIGGAATLIGDPPNIIIASRSGLTFNDFLLNIAPIAALALVALCAMLPLLFRGSFHVDPERAADVMGLDEREAIKDRRLLVLSGIVLTAVFIGFVGHTAFHIEPSIVALLGAGVLLLVSRSKARDVMPGVEWETLVFFAGLFIMVGALVKTGVIGRVAEAAAAATGGDALVASMLILGVSALLSGIVDNIPYTAAMSPVVLQLTQGVADPTQAEALWWSLAIGADFGGNLTAIGASANVVVLGIAARNGTPISFWEFTRKGALVTVVTILLAAPYLWLRYFVLAG